MFALIHLIVGHREYHHGHCTRCHDGTMSSHFLRVLAQRRYARALTAEAPERAELRKIVAAAAGPQDSDEPLTWRLIGTHRSEAPELALALSGLKHMPDLKDTTPRLKGKQMRRVAAFRGSLAFASRGGLALAVIFHPQSASGEPKRVQRGDAFAARALLQTAFFASGWATQWAPRKSPDEEVLAEFYGLDADEEVLGWLFVGRPDPSVGADDSATLPPAEPPLQMR